MLIDATIVYHNTHVGEVVLSVSIMPPYKLLCLLHVNMLASTTTKFSTPNFSCTILSLGVAISVGYIGFCLLSGQYAAYPPEQAPIPPFDHEG